jgi:hypothetical protein
LKQLASRLKATLTNKKEINMSKQKTPMTPAAAARIQSATAKQTGGQIPKGSFPAKAQKAAAKNVNGRK